MNTQVIINLICMAVFWGFVSYSGFIGTIEEGLSRMTVRKGYKIHIPKPFSCSLCCQFWCSVIYVLTAKELSFEIIPIICVTAWSTLIIEELFGLVRDMILQVMSWVRKLLKI